MATGTNPAEKNIVHKCDQMKVKKKIIPSLTFDIRIKM